MDRDHIPAEGESVVCVVARDGIFHSELLSLLRHLRMPVESYYDAPSFLRRPGGAHISCVVVESEQVGLSSKTFLQELSRRGLAGHTIILTTHPDLGEAVTAIKSGVADYIEMPLSERRLLARIEEVVGSGLRTSSEASH